MSYNFQTFEVENSKKNEYKIKMNSFEGSHFLYAESKNNRLEKDDEIAKILNMTLEEYHQKLINDFNGVKKEWGNEILVNFKNKANAMKAIAWAQSRYVGLKLGGQM
jgi:hypothetical protein